MMFEQGKGEEGHLRGFHAFLPSAPFEALIAHGGNSVHRNVGGL